MSKLDQIKEKRRKELLDTLELKKKQLQEHFDEGANNTIEVGKGFIIVGTGVLILYTILDRYLESKFKPNKKGGTTSTSKASVNKLLFPIYSILLQQGASALFKTGQKKLINYLNSRKQKNELLSGSLSEEE